jgi:hypothetical protein
MNYELPSGTFKSHVTTTSEGISVNPHTCYGLAANHVMSAQVASSDILPLANSMADAPKYNWSLHLVFSI